MATPAAQQRRLQHRAEARRSILDAAEVLLVEGGLETFSMRQLADRCGYTAPTIYHYFRDKPTLVDTLLEERLRDLAEDLRAAPHSEDPARNVRALGAAFASWGVRNPGHYQLLMMYRGDDAPEPPSTEDVQRQFDEPLDELVTNGELETADVESLRQGLWSLIHGFILLQTTRPDEDWEPDLLERSLDAMIVGARSWGRDANER